MYSLDKTTRKLVGFLAAAASPNLEVTVTYHDVIQQTKTDVREYPRGVQISLLADTPEVTILDAPAQIGTYRHIDNITVYNADNANATVTIAIDDSGTNSTLISHTLTTTQSLIYDAGVNGSGGSWQVI